MSITISVTDEGVRDEQGVYNENSDVEETFRFPLWKAEAFRYKNLSNWNGCLLRYEQENNRK
jgi:hypothetical protein